VVCCCLHADQSCLAAACERGEKALINSLVGDRQTNRAQKLGSPVVSPNVTICRILSHYLTNSALESTFESSL
jgi:hypothetical protein